MGNEKYDDTKYMERTAAELGTISVGEIVGVGLFFYGIHKIYNYWVWTPKSAFPIFDGILMFVGFLILLMYYFEYL